MAKSKMTTDLRIREKYKKMFFVGTNGKFQYDEPRMLGDMSDEELEEFYYSHDAKTVNMYLIGQPKAKKVNKEELPIKPEE